MIKVTRLKDDSYEISFESMATGKDGNVYALFCETIKAGSGYKIISFYDGKINEICDGEILPYEDIYSAIGTSTKYDLVMKGIYGVYGYNFGMDFAEKIMRFPPLETKYTRSWFTDNELFMFHIDVEDEGVFNVRSLELKVIDLDKGKYF